MGRAIRNLDGTIRDTNSGAILAVDTEGEICVRGATVFAGYVSNGVDGLRLRDGWLHMGDLAVKHEDNTYTFRGLIKAMFTSNGFNIYPREIEAAIGRMPGVASVHARLFHHPSLAVATFTKTLGLIVRYRLPTNRISHLQILASCALSPCVYAAVLGPGGTGGNDGESEARTETAGSIMSLLRLWK